MAPRLILLILTLALLPACALLEDEDDGSSPATRETVSESEQQEHEEYQREMQRRREQRVEQLTGCVEAAEADDDQAGVRDCYRRYGG